MTLDEIIEFLNKNREYFKKRNKDGKFRGLLMGDGFVMVQFADNSGVAMRSNIKEKGESNV